MMNTDDRDHTPTAPSAPARDSHAWCDYCKVPPAAPCYHWCKLMEAQIKPAPSEVPMPAAYDAVQQQIVERYVVVQRTSGGCWGYAVKAGDGSMELHIGHKKGCESVRAALQTACLDGAWLAAKSAAAREAAATAELRAENQRLLAMDGPRVRKMNALVIQGARDAEKIAEMEAALERVRGVLRNCENYINLALWHFGGQRGSGLLRDAIAAARAELGGGVR